MEDAEFCLTGLPNDDVFFYTKTIDNSRLVRQSGTQVKGEWSTIAGACVIAALIGCTAIAPGVTGTLESYKIQELKHEQELLQTELRQVNVAEERMINAPALDAMAPQHNLVRPGTGQLIRLQPGNEHSVAMNRSLPSRSR